MRKDPLYHLKKAFLRWRPSGRIQKLELGEVMASEVLEIIKNFKNSHAFGRDKLDTATIKSGGKYLAGPIAHMINLSLGTARFPAKWKLARILPILKVKGADENSPASFRPISQLPVISKIAECVVQSRLLQHLEQHNLLSTDHHGYRSNLSTTSALLEIMDAISTATDMNWVTSTMSIDQTSAFDCMEHPILIQKLQYYFLDDKLIQWIRSYLENRSSLVVIGSAESNISRIEYGVPQGSVLGPLLYLLYTNEFSQCIEDDNCRNPCHTDATILFGSNCQQCGMMTLYADDAQYMTTGRSRMTNQIRLEDSFIRIMDFLESNGLELNQGKTTLTEFMSAQKRAKLAGIPQNSLSGSGRMRN